MTTTAKLILAAFVLFAGIAAYVVFSHSTASASNPSSTSALDPALAAVYLRAEAEFLEKSNALGKPVDTAVANMVTDCKAKKIGDKISLDGRGVPSCQPYPPTPVPAPTTPVPAAITTGTTPPPTAVKK